MVDGNGNCWRSAILASLALACSPWLIFAAASKRERSRCSLQTVSLPSGDISWEEFNSKYRKRAVVLLNLTGRWKGWRDGAWKDQDVFLKRFGHVKVNLLAHVAYNRTAPGHGETFHVPTMQEYMTNPEIRHHLQFAFDNYAAYRAFRPVCRPYAEALLQVHQKPLISLGTKGSGSGGHAHEANWVAQLNGRKVWIVAPPRENGQRWPSLVKNVCDMYKNQKVLPPGAEVCVVHPGETIYLPDLWYHGTCNLDEFNFAIGGKGFSDHWPRHLYYIQAGNLDAVKKAAAAGVDVTRGSGLPDTQPPVHLAAKVGPISMLEFLLERRADPYTFDRDGSQAVHKAAEQGPLEVLQWLIKSRISTIHDKEKDTKFLPMHSAAFSGSWHKLEWLLSVRSNINSPESTGSTILHLAAGGGHAKFCETLLAHRANLHRRDQYGRDAADWAAGLNRVAALGFLMDRGSKHIGSYLEQSIQHGRYDTTKLMLERRVSLNERTNARMRTRPLHIAVANGHVEIAQLLLQRRSNTDLKDQSGRTAVDLGKSSQKGQQVARYIEAFKRRKSEL